MHPYSAKIVQEMSDAIEILKIWRVPLDLAVIVYGAAN